MPEEAGTVTDIGARAGHNFSAERANDAAGVFEGRFTPCAKCGAGTSRDPNRPRALEVRAPDSGAASGPNLHPVHDDAEYAGSPAPALSSCRSGRGWTGGR